MVSTFPKMSTVELLVIEENLHRNTYLGGRSNQIDIFFKKKKKKRVVQTSTTKLPAFQKLRGRAGKKQSGNP